MIYIVDILGYVTNTRTAINQKHDFNFENNL